MNLTEKQRDQLIKSMNLYQLVRMYNILNERLNMDENKIQLYKIRNGKAFVKELDPYSKEDSLRYRIFKEDIVEEMKERYTGKLNHLRFELNKDIRLAMPTSLKELIGNIPNYSYIDIDKSESFKIGSYWTEEMDIDMHGDLIEGGHIGFYSTIIDEGITLSGDMTHLNHEGYAAEYFLLEPYFRNSVAITNTLYSHRNHGDKWKFKLVIARDDSNSPDRKSTRLNSSH